MEGVEGRLHRAGVRAGEVGHVVAVDLGEAKSACWMDGAAAPGDTV
jgi:hypothetical protein